MSKKKKDSESDDDKPGLFDKVKGSIGGLLNAVNGISRTDGVSPIGIIGRNGK